MSLSPHLNPTYPLAGPQYWRRLSPAKLAIIEHAAANPEASTEAIAEKFDLTPLIVKRLLATSAAEQYIATLKFIEQSLDLYCYSAVDDTDEPSALAKLGYEHKKPA